MFVSGLLSVARKHLVTTTDESLVRNAARLLHDSRFNLVVVCAKDGTIAGVVSKTDVVRQIGHCSGSACTATASSVMTPEVICCRPTDRLQDVWSLMKAHSHHHIPVIDDETYPLGVMTSHDALQALLREATDEESLLRDYIMGIGYH